MDYFGSIVEELCDLWEEIEASPYAKDAGPVLKALEKAMKAAAVIERQRNAIAAAQSTLAGSTKPQLTLNERKRRAA